MGTDWTNVGSQADVVVTADSATYMNGQHKHQYRYASGLDHGELARVTSGTFSACSSHNGSSWTAVDLVNPVQLARNAVYYSSTR